MKKTMDKELIFYIISSLQESSKKLILFEVGSLFESIK